VKAFIHCSKALGQHMSIIGGVDRRLRHGGAVCRWVGKGYGRSGRLRHLYARTGHIGITTDITLECCSGFKSMSFEGVRT
jgi:hypothetical protein